MECENAKCGGAIDNRNDKTETVPLREHVSLSKLLDQESSKIKQQDRVNNDTQESSVPNDKEKSSSDDKENTSSNEVIASRSGSNSKDNKTSLTQGKPSSTSSSSTQGDHEEPPENIAPCHVPLRRIPSMELPKRIDSLSDDSFLTDITTPDHSMGAEIVEKRMTSPLFIPSTDGETPVAPKPSVLTEDRKHCSSERDKTKWPVKKPGENVVRLAKKSTGQLACKSTGTGVIISKTSKLFRCNIKQLHESYFFYMFCSKCVRLHGEAFNVSTLNISTRHLLIFAYEISSISYPFYRPNLEIRVV